MSEEKKDCGNCTYNGGHRCLLTDAHMCIDGGHTFWKPRKQQEDFCKMTSIDAMRTTIAKYCNLSDDCSECIASRGCCRVDDMVGNDIVAEFTKLPSEWREVAHMCHENAQFCDMMDTEEVGCPDCICHDLCKSQETVEDIKAINQRIHEQSEPVHDSPKLSVRAEVLREAEKVVCGHREHDYGTPENNFTAIAELWDAYLNHIYGEKLSARDVAIMMCLFKIGRTTYGKGTKDTFVDLAGYAACAAEVSGGNENELR